MQANNLEAGAFPVNPLETVLTTALAQEAHVLVRHLGDVLNLQPTDRVLLVPGDAGMTGLTLVQAFDCQLTVLVAPGTSVEPNDDRLTVHQGTVKDLPFTDNSFDAVIVAAPLTSGLQTVAGELARVLGHSGRLGLVAHSTYRDQLSEDAELQPSTVPFVAHMPPAAAYRVVLGEAGFTAFVTEDRRRQVRRTAAAVYREHQAQAEPHDSTLGLLASGGLSVTLITAEKGI